MLTSVWPFTWALVVTCPSLPVQQCDLTCDYSLLSLGFLIMDMIKNPVCGVVRINTTKCKAVAWDSVPSRSLRNDGKKMEEEGGGLGGAARIPRPAARSKGKKAQAALAQGSLCSST